MNRRAIHITLLWLLVIATACAPLPAQPPPAPTGSKANTAEATEQTIAHLTISPGNAANELRAEEIPGKISQLEAISRNPTISAAEKSDSLRQLTLLHLSPQNSARSFKLAAATQAAYVETLAPGALRQEGEIWLDLLKMARDSENLQRQQALDNRGKDQALAALGAEKQRLLQKITTLEASNAKLEGDIEKLKFIDLSMEKKRKNSH